MIGASWSSFQVSDSLSLLSELNRIDKAPIEENDTKICFLLLLARKYSVEFMVGIGYGSSWSQSKHIRSDSTSITCWRHSKIGQINEIVAALAILPDPANLMSPIRRARMIINILG